MKNLTLEKAKKHFKVSNLTFIKDEIFFDFENEEDADTFCGILSLIPRHKNNYKKEIDQELGYFFYTVRLKE